MAVNEEAPRSAAPHSVRIGRGAVPWAARDFRIVHVGQSAVILADDGAASPLVPLTSASRGLVPSGVCLPHDSEFAELRDLAQAALVRSGRLDLTGWTTRPPREITVRDLRMSPVALSVPAVAALRSATTAAGLLPELDPLMDPRHQRRLAEPLAEAALAGATGLVRHHLRALVGAGPGTTPAGDDVVVGALATFAATDPAAHARIASLVPALLHRTTTAARHDLVAATRGEFSEHLHGLVAALADEQLVGPTVARARGWGATSGLDLAAGVAGVAATLLRRPTAAALTPVRHDHHHLRRSA